MAFLSKWNLPLMVILIMGSIVLLFTNHLSSVTEPKKTIILVPDLHNKHVPQNYPDDIDDIRQNHIIKPSINSTYNLKNPRIKDTSQYHQATALAKLFKNKQFGTFVEAGAYDGESLSNTLPLERDLHWTGLLVEPDPSTFNTLKKKNRKANIIHGCLSPTKFVKEVSFSARGAFGRIVDPAKKKSQRYSIKVKCFPLFSLLLAQNLTQLDLLSLDIEGDELKILKTVPWNMVDITALLVEVTHIPEGKDVLKKFLEDNNYELHSQVAEDSLFVKKNKLPK